MKVARARVWNNCAVRAARVGQRAPTEGRREAWRPKAQRAAVASGERSEPRSVGLGAKLRKGVGGLAPANDVVGAT